LNNDSKLSYPEHFSGWQRVVKLEGEGYFEVFHDETNPFFVETNGFAVKVLGTVFDVRNYPNDAIPEVVLLSGRIEVDIKKGSESVQLLPNQKMSYNKQTGNYDIASIDAPEYALWKNDKLVMDNEELETIFRKIGRWYNVDIVYDKNLPLTSRHTITITSEAKEEILRLLSITMPIKYQIENDKVIIKRK
jgi:ferric-dicitrate binding protein FerR (iron transport regulator)